MDVTPAESSKRGVGLRGRWRLLVATCAAVFVAIFLFRWGRSPQGRSASVVSTAAPTSGMLLDWGHHFRVTLPQGAAGPIVATFPIDPAKLVAADPATLVLARFDPGSRRYEAVARVPAGHARALSVAVSDGGTYSLLSYPSNAELRSTILTFCGIRTLRGLWSPLRVCPLILCAPFDRLGPDSFPRGPLPGRSPMGSICATCMASGMGHIFECDGLPGRIPILPGPWPPPTGPNAVDEYVAKLYTEALGRAPDPNGWRHFTRALHGNPCDATALAKVGRSFYTSVEYESLGYSPEERVLTLYRGALSREPEAGGYAAWVSQLAVRSWTWVVAEFFRSPEFLALAGTICRGPATSYGFGRETADGCHDPGEVALHIPTAPTGAGCAQGGPNVFTGGTDVALQHMLDTAGLHIWLAQRVVVEARRTIHVWPGQTLATCGLPDRRQYARMARIVRSSVFGAPVVQVDGGATLRSVWVSGQTGPLSFDPSVVGREAPNILVHGGLGGGVERVRTDSPAGWTTLHVLGMAETRTACSGVRIADNLSTGYTSCHARCSPVCESPPGSGTFARARGWSDGISVACEGAVVEGNDVVDPTDVGIVVFRACPAEQRSRVVHNTVVVSGPGAYGGLGFDPLTAEKNLECPSGPGFAGAEISENQLLTGRWTHADFGFFLGTRAFPIHANGPWVNGSGASMVNNTMDPGANVNTGIAVDGMLNAVVRDNVVPIAPSHVSACPQAVVGADEAGGHASGSIQTYQQAEFHNCIGHP